MFIFIYGFSAKVISAFSFRKIILIKDFWCEKDDVISHIFDQIKALREPS